MRGNERVRRVYREEKCKKGKGSEGEGRKKGDKKEIIRT